MDAKELRIGNLVNKKYHEYPANTGSYWSENPMVLNDFEGIVEYPKVYKPIPLTPEWLEKFAEKLSKESNWYELGPFRIAFFDGSYGYTVSVSYKNDSVRWDFKEYYVHQLQNLYFALTGNELNEKTNH